MTKRSLPGVIAALVLLCLAAGIFAWSYMDATPRAPRAWYYDLATGELFPAPPGSQPPIPGPSNAVDDAGLGTGVRAHVFTCGSCEDADATFIAFLETNTPEVKRKLDAALEDDLLPEADPAVSSGLIAQTHLVSRADPIEWVQGSSAPGQRIRQRSLEPCPDGAVPRPCRPR